MENSSKELLSFCGYLEKKSPSFFGGWQKRYFKLVDGQVWTYSDKENDKDYKGTINLEEITNLKSVEKKNFNFDFGGRLWELRAESEELRDRWIRALKFCIERINRGDQSTRRESLEVQSRSRAMSSKHWKKGQQDVTTLDLLKKSGFQSKDDQLSAQALKTKIKYLNPELPEIKSRINFGFLNKKHKKDYLNQKRWFFLISSRPLNDVDYEKDDLNLFKNPSGINLDTLYYYSFDGETDDSKQKGEIKMIDCSELQAIDKENKFLLIVDMGDRKYEFESEMKGERDKWYVSLKNSRRTAKEFKKSITKKPRNIACLINIIETEGIGKLKEIVEKEKEDIVKNYADIKEFDLLESFYIKNLQDKLYQTLDGCTVVDPPRTEIIKPYCEVFNASYLYLIKQFWSLCYANVDQPQMVKLATLLFQHEHYLTQFGITDPNFSQNGRELTKIFIKKTFMNLKPIIENILKSEREVKAVRSSDNLLITNGPMDLFKLFYSLLDIFKKENHRTKYILEQLLYLFKECALSYLIGLDCVTSLTSLDIEKEFLLGIANNSIKINSQYDDLLDEVKSLNILSDEEVEEASGKGEIMKSLSFIANNAISRFVVDLSDDLMVEFEDQFLSLDINKILQVTFEIYGAFTNLMHVSIQKKCWAEVLRATLFQYIKSLLTTAHKNVKKIEDLTNKLRADKETILDAYRRVLGEFLTLETLKVLNDFLDFLDVSADMISVSCSKLREFNGPSFSLNTCKALINLRVDLSKEEKNEAISTCKEILTDFSNGRGEGNKTSNAFFKNLESEMEEQEKLEQEAKMHAENLDEIQEPSQVKEKRNSFRNLSDFLGLGIDSSDLIDDESKETETNTSTIKQVSNKGKSEILIDSDVSMAGVMQKKTYNTWQERFFQIKHGFLFWYKDQSSKEAQNSIPVVEMKKVQSHKPAKFLIVCGEKVYKFACKDDDVKDQWMKAIEAEMKKAKSEATKKLENLCEMKLKKKVIEDYYNLPSIHAEKIKTKTRVDEAIKSEGFFKEKSKSKPTTKVNKKILEKHQNYDELNRPKTLNTSSSRSDISPLNIGLIDKKPKKTNSIFSCCNKIMMLFKKQKTADDYEI